MKYVPGIKYDRVSFMLIEIEFNNIDKAIDYAIENNFKYVLEVNEDDDIVMVFLAKRRGGK